jgi:hypothetical protein
MGHTKFFIAQIRARRRFLLLVISFLLQDYFKYKKWRKIKKYRHRYLRHHLAALRRKDRTTSDSTQEKTRRRRLAGNTVNIPLTKGKLFERTGLYEDTFEILFKKMEKDIVAPRNGVTKSIVSCILTPRARLCMALHWMRKYPHESDLADIYHVTKGTVSVEIHHIVPKLYIHLNFINWDEGVSKVNV